MDTKQSPTNLGLSFGGVNCLVVFPTHNPNSSLLTLLQISLLFMCTPALTFQGGNQGISHLKTLRFCAFFETFSVNFQVRRL